MRWQSSTSFFLTPVPKILPHLSPPRDVHRGRPPGLPPARPAQPSPSQRLPQALRLPAGRPQPRRLRFASPPAPRPRRTPAHPQPPPPPPGARKEGGRPATIYPPTPTPGRAPLRAQPPQARLPHAGDAAAAPTASHTPGRAGPQLARAPSQTSGSQASSLPRPWLTLVLQVEKDEQEGQRGAQAAGGGRGRHHLRRPRPRRPRRQPGPRAPTSPGWVVGASDWPRPPARPLGRT